MTSGILSNKGGAISIAGPLSSRTVELSFVRIA
jgi:hypothetical protein